MEWANRPLVLADGRRFDWLMGSSQGGEPNNEQERPAEAADRPLSQGELESSLTDIRAEVYLIEAQRMETERLVASAESQDPVELERLTDRLRRMAARLEELEARTAGLRARLEQLPGSRRAGARRGIPRKRRDERRLKPRRRAR